MSATAHLDRIIEVISKSGDPDKDFYYLGGPMTGIPQFNFPRFKEVAEILRGNTMNIISPAELDDPDTEAAALASVDGAPGSGAAHDEPYEYFLARDIVVVSLPTCVGGIFLKDWHHSRGARAETWVLQFLGKKLYEYHDGPYEGEIPPRLIPIKDRDSRLRELDIQPEGVPQDLPGERTAAARDGFRSNGGVVEIAEDYRLPAFIGRGDPDGEDPRRIGGKI